MLTLLFVAGCASGGVDRHPQVAMTRTPYAFDGVFMTRTRGGQLAASREWERPTAPQVSRSDDDEVRGVFASELARSLPFDPTAPLRVRATLTLQDIGYFEGLAAESADITLHAEITDADGNVLHTITMRESASAPLQRSASRKARLETAMARLARRLAAQL